MSIVAGGHLSVCGATCWLPGGALSLLSDRDRSDGGWHPFSVSIEQDLRFCIWADHANTAVLSAANKHPCPRGVAKVNFVSITQNGRRMCACAHDEKSYCGVTITVAG
eukprot:COSAG01_NODE_567_length_15336_cov_341.292689_6_plen_108_part_00